MWVEIVGLIVGLLLLGVGGFIALTYARLKFLAMMFEDIVPVPPSKDNESVTDSDDRNPLTRHVPQIRGKLAWKEIGEFPTPNHQVKLKLDSGKTVSFWMKREDLSSGVYGGNKVRTLQYQLPACVTHAKAHPSAKFCIIGSGGSNQVVATMAHGTPLGLKFHIAYVVPDNPDFDNALNFLSTLSYRPLSIVTWNQPHMKALLKTIFSKVDRIFGLGGVSVGGILGQMGGAIELAEQIENGEIPDVDEIYVTQGSSCTTTGLILGICLARHLKMNAFKSHRFKLVSVMNHGDSAAKNRKFGIMKNWYGQFLALSPYFGILRTSAYFKKLTGINLKAAGVSFMRNEWEIFDGAEIIGKYGTHSELSLKAASHDSAMEIKGKVPKWYTKSDSPPAPWLCGHFTGKGFAFMLERLEKRDDDVKVLFWQTKSHVQPLGDKQDEWEEFQRITTENSTLKEWSTDVKGASVLRPGKVDAVNGSAVDYRKLMTPA